MIPSSVLYFPIGWIYLWTRYRNKNRIEQVLLEKYENSYYVAGVLLIWKSFGIVFLFLVFVLICTAIFATFKFGIE